MAKKISIIKEDVNFLYPLQNKLSLSGFEVDADLGRANNVEEIINSIKVNKPEYIILDLILPYVNGFELLSSIKGDADIFSIPVFVFTNLSDSNSKSRSEQLGIDYYFIKSEFSVDEFISKVLKIIKNREKLDGRRSRLAGLSNVYYI